MNKVLFIFGLNHLFKRSKEISLTNKYLLILDDHKFHVSYKQLLKSKIKVYTL